MNNNEPQNELLLRYLDGQITQKERSLLSELLRTDPEARAFLRECAEQSVMVADLERMTLGRQQELVPRACLPADNYPKPAVRQRLWRWATPAFFTVIAFAFLASAAIQRFLPDKPWIVRVSKATSSSQIFGSNGELKTSLDSGTLLSSGDTLETRSCDSWIELDLRDGSKMTIGGHSTLRILEGEAGKICFNLANGNLWVSPSPELGAKSLVIQTPTLRIETRNTQFDLKTSTSESMLRVNKGVTRVIQHLDGSAISVSAGYQVIVSLANKGPLAVLPQPKPINRWASNIGRMPEVLVGKWLPPINNGLALLGAAPLLWPIPNRDPVMLYAAALSVVSSSDRPVLLQSGSHLLFRGRTLRPHTVRFGFSTQIMQGVFAGKFELDVKPDLLGPAGNTWEVKLPISDFRAMQPQLSVTPNGLELMDVYALTINEDAGLEINHIELVADGPEQSPVYR